MDLSAELTRGSDEKRFAQPTFPMQAAEVRPQVCGQVLSYESPFGLGGRISGCAVSFDWLTRGASVVGPREPDCSDSMPAFAL